MLEFDFTDILKLLNSVWLFVPDLIEWLIADIDVNISNAWDYLYNSIARSFVNDLFATVITFLEDSVNSFIDDLFGDIVTALPQISIPSIRLPFIYISSWIVGKLPIPTYLLGLSVTGLMGVGIMIFGSLFNTILNVIKFVWDLIMSLVEAVLGAFIPL